MKTKFTKAMRMLGAFAILGAIIACGGDDEEEGSSTTTSATEPPAQGVAAAQPGAAAAGAPVPLAVGQPPATLNVPIPPSFNLQITTPAEYQIDVTTTSSGDPRIFLYQGDTLLEDNDDGGEGLNSRIVRFLAPGTYSIRVVELRTQPMSVQGQVQQLQPPTPVGQLTLGQPFVVQFPELSLMNMPSNDREASRTVTLQVAAPGQYTCTATMDGDRRAKIALIQNGSLLATDEQSFREQNASITAAGHLRGPGVGEHAVLPRLAAGDRHLPPGLSAPSAAFAAPPPTRTAVPEASGAAVSRSRSPRCRRIRGSAGSPLPKAADLRV